ncbi:MAG: DUF2975 domain-containing protein [Pseudomonadota bacterium]
MSNRYPRALGVSFTLLSVMRVLNLVAGAILVASFLASFLFEPVFLDFFGKEPSRLNPGLLIGTLRLWMVLGLPMIAAVHVLLSRLLSMVETVRLGDPFVPENAVRMKTIAWCLLAVQILHLSFGLMAAIMNAAGSRIDWTFSITGWVAVVLLFVLARVFEEGTCIRADLEAMV